MPLEIKSDLKIASASRRLLAQELKNYSLNPRNGRSFLIAGHRGAGKTALVRHAIADVMADKNWLGQGVKPLRFLPIEIHGPSLFVRRETRKEDSKQATADAASRGADEPAKAEGGPGSPQGQQSTVAPTSVADDERMLMDNTLR